MGIGVACDLTALAGVPLVLAALAGPLLATLVGYLRERWQMWRSGDGSFGRSRAVDTVGWTIGALLPAIVALSLS